ncbi:hypothetical protein Aduo_005231 [Ancylostoma duodenale]
MNTENNESVKVISCPPLTEGNVSTDLWSSVRMPSGIGCSTVLGADEAALAAAKILASHDYMIFGRILCQQLNNLSKLLGAERTLQK